MQTKKSCIIFARVSTDRQEYEEQTNRVRILAERYGYTRDRHIVIENKESGIRLSEEERLGLNKMKEVILANKVDCVFAFEISRLARTKKVLFSVEEFLVSHHIQLIIDEPRLELLNADGSVNDAAEMVFTLYAQMAESEMRLKQGRFRNGKKRKKNMGKYIGGFVPWGFMVDEDKNLVPDPDMREVVILFFEKFASGLSQTYLRIYMDSIGQHISASNIGYLIHNDRYSQIVQPELWKKVVEQREKTAQPRSKNRRWSFGEQILVCLHCGRHSLTSSNSYTCAGRGMGYKHTSIECKDGVGFQRDRVDCCLVESALKWKIRWIRLNGSQQEEHLRQMSKETTMRVYTLSNKLNKVDEKIEKYTDSYACGYISKETLDKRISSINEERNKMELELSHLNAKKLELDINMEQARKNKKLPYMEASDQLEKMTKQQIYELVHEQIDRAFFGRENDERILRILSKLFHNETTTYIFRSTGRTFRLIQLIGDGEVDVTDIPAYKIRYRDMI